MQLVISEYILLVVALWIIRLPNYYAEACLVTESSAWAITLNFCQVIFGQVPDRQKYTRHMSPPCRSTGVPKNEKKNITNRHSDD